MYIYSHTYIILGPYDTQVF